jgi:opacity protein-like surface antigen
VKRATATVLMGLALAAHPVAARAETTRTWLAGVATAGLASLTCASVALTAGEDAEQDEFARRGWLIGVAASYAIETFKDDAESDAQEVYGPTASLSVDNSFGFNGRVGYRCHRWFSAEVGVEWLDGFKTDLSDPGPINIGIDIEPIVVTANMKGYLLTGRYQPFLLVGGGVMTAEFKFRGDPGSPGSITETEYAMRFGGGVDLYATKNVVVSLEADYVLPVSSLSDLDYISIGVGLQYRF